MYNILIFTDITDNLMSPVSLGAYKIAHSLRTAGYTCLVINHLSDWSQEELQNLLDLTISKETILVGFSTTFLRSIEIERDPSKPTPPYPEIGVGTVFPQGKQFENDIISYIKTKNSQIKFMVGGVRTSQDYSNRNINYAFIGYSEVSIVNLADHLTKQVLLTNSLKNIWGVTIIDDRLAKSYDFANSDMTWLDTDVVNHKVLPIEIGRGCVFRCKFCDYPMNGKKQLDYIKRTDLIIKELENNYNKFGIKHYYIVDDTFNDHPKKLEIIRDAVKTLDFTPVFWGYHRLDLICTHPETLPILYDIGVRAMFFGIETFDENTGKIIGKGYRRSKQISMLKHIKKTYPDLTLHGSFMIGLPEESITSVRATFDAIMDRDIPLDSWKWYGLKLFNTSKITFNSELSQNLLKYGYVDLGSDPESIFVNWGNEYTNNTEANDLAFDFMEQGMSSGRITLSGEASLYLSDIGYKDFSTLTKIPHRDIEWNYIEYTVKPNFVNNYKQQLIKLIKS
jgi:hypothetical protein